MSTLQSSNLDNMARIGLHSVLLLLFTMTIYNFTTVNLKSFNDAVNKTLSEMLRETSHFAKTQPITSVNGLKNNIYVALTSHVLPIIGKHDYKN